VFVRMIPSFVVWVGCWNKMGGSAGQYRPILPSSHDCVLVTEMRHFSPPATDFQQIFAFKTAFEFVLSAGEFVLSGRVS